MAPRSRTLPRPRARSGSRPSILSRTTSWSASCAIGWPRSMRADGAGLVSSEIGARRRPFRLGAIVRGHAVRRTGAMSDDLIGEIEMAVDPGDDKSTEGEPAPGLGWPGADTPPAAGGSGA